MVVLKAGAFTMDSRLDRVEEKDLRSRRYAVADIIPAKHYEHPRSYTWATKVSLNQGCEGACVGFAWAHELAARPAAVFGIDENFAREAIYFNAQQLDQYPGGEYPGALPYAEGTSVLGGAKAVQQLGYISEYRWAFDFWDLVASVGYRGPAIFGCSWFSAMRKTDSDGFVKPTGVRRGEHCVALLGIKVVKDRAKNISLKDSFFTFQNSWGEDWGVAGFGKLRFEDVLMLWSGAETCIPIKRHCRPNLKSREVSR